MGADPVVPGPVLDALDQPAACRDLTGRAIGQLAAFQVHLDLPAPEMPANELCGERILDLPLDGAPMFDVMIRIVFLKFTLLPSPSVRCPSSKTCSRMLKMSGCAFSISSSRTTEYGFLRTFSVSWPPSSCPT